MKRSIRPSVPEDAPAIVALFAELGLQPNIRPEDLQWKYWAQRADWSGPRSFVLTSDGVVVAHAAMIPGALLDGTQPVTTGHVIDWVARRGEAGAGMALMKHVGQQVQALWAFGGSADTLRILPHLGFRAVGTVTGYARPLLPLRILSGDVSFRWKLLPRLARNLWWKFAAPQTGTGAWRVRAVTNHAVLARIQDCLPEAANGAAVLKRSPELLRYILGCTIVRTALYTLERAGRVGGYFVLTHAPGQVRIIDCWMNSQDPADWRAMLNGAVVQASRDPEAAEVVLWASGDFQRAMAQACGFRERFRFPIQIRASAGTTANTWGLNVQMLDNDAAYLHEDLKTHWI
jgi:hypothetical protein